MKRALYDLAVRAVKALTPKPDLAAENRHLKTALDSLVDRTMRDQREAAYWEHVSELIEARQMAGTGPWRASPAALAETDRIITIAANRLTTPAGSAALRESSPVLTQGAYGDIELALQNVEWRREINLSWLEFSRWGVQQLILISRLYFVKNPLIQRGVNLAAQYVFGRGVEISSPDEKANQALNDFRRANQTVLGQTGLAELQKRLFYDGQIFFALFADTSNAGTVQLRTIDATEIMDVVTNPDDADEPWFYRREWTQRNFDRATGNVTTETLKAWYPALGSAGNIPDRIGEAPVMKNIPIIHMKGGVGVSKWHFHVPKVYAALDWAKTARNMLEWCATIRKSLAQISMTLTTKGGQQALAGAKQQLETTVGPSSFLWDTNPPSVAGSIFASGPGTALAAFKTQGAGGDPSEVKEYRNMVACVLEIPPTWLGDMETSNLSTAITLDRPTELGFREKQERWREVLVQIAKYVLQVSHGAPSGKLRESAGDKLRVVEMQRRLLPSGRYRYEAAKTPEPGTVEVRVDFPAIREGDLPMLIKAWSDAGTLGNTSGQIVGIDDKTLVRGLLTVLDVENADELAEEMYPEKGYDVDRTAEPEPPPAPAPPAPGAAPAVPGHVPPQAEPPHPPVNGNAPAKQQEAVRRLIAAVGALRETRATNLSG